MNSAVFLALPVLAFFWALMFVLPHLSPRRYFFGITVRPDFPGSEIGRAILRRYYLRLAVVAVLSVAIVWLPLQDNPGTLLTAVYLPLVIGLIAWLRARKETQPHSVSTASIREAGLSIAPDHLPRWIAWALPAFAAPVAAAAYLRAHWDELPRRFPVHYDLAGNPNRWVEKTERAVYGPILAEAGLMLVLLLLAVATFYGARRGAQRNAVLKIIIAAIYFLAYTFTNIALNPIVHIPAGAYLVASAVFVVALLAWCWKLARDPQMPVDPTPDEHWTLGAIYHNPNDPAVFVQKRIGFGYTLNFGNPLAWLGLGIFAAVLLLIVLVFR